MQPRFAPLRVEASPHGMISRLCRDDADFEHLHVGQRTTGSVDSLTGKIALVFPGQGSQFVGMGKALYDASAAARRVFDQADEV
ncbi:MAG: malonyl CoA-acyl carrier protein transacylase, partial [Thermomicrobiales bacterium]|nr:malonyl CoA-acyl carrier protein transacylase [Thermomicrobiales bacterium]